MMLQSWFESGAVHDILIRNNVFDQCGYNSGSGAIHIAPENREWVKGKTIHENIRVTGTNLKLQEALSLKPAVPVNSSLQTIQSRG
jgi:hypothetical protein